MKVLLEERKGKLEEEDLPAKVVLLVEVLLLVEEALQVKVVLLVEVKVQGGLLLQKIL